MKKIWVGTSWKMNKDQHAAEAWASAVQNVVDQYTDNIQPFVIPPFPYLSLISQYFAKTPMKVGAQNMCWAPQGAYTGEVSPLMIKDCGAQLVELGHSERRHMFGETDHTVNQKVLSALENGLTPLVCIGDTSQEKQWGVSIESVIRQVKIALYQVPQEQISKVILAYEPVWAIGEQGIPASAEEAEAIHLAIRQALTQSYGEAVANQSVVLYGGSVNLGNAARLLSQKNIDGIFVGRSAWNEKDYIKLLNIAKEL